MSTAGIIFRCLPFFAMVGYGVYYLLEVVFPSLRDKDFNYWEVDNNSGSYLNLLGWRIVLVPPRVLAQGYLSDNAACAVAIGVGIFLIVLGLAAVHKIAGVP